MTRRFFLAFAALLLVAPPLCAQASAPTLTVMSFNIRYADTKSPNSWAARRPGVKQVIVDAGADIIGMQEALWQQIVDIDRDLPAEFQWVALGRDGGSRGEHMAVFYKSSRFEPVALDHFWLSQTPNLIGSVVPGACCPRMVTWIRFREIVSGKEFYFVNTHFDHISQPARELSARLLLERVAQFDSNLAVIVTGDFNSDALTNPIYRMMVPDSATRDAVDSQTLLLQDTWTLTQKAEPTFGTFHNFRGPEGSTGAARIDWILVRGPVQALSTEIRLDNLNGQYPSDHFPVIARLRFLTGR